MEVPERSSGVAGMPVILRPATGSGRDRARGVVESAPATGMHGWRGDAGGVGRSRATTHTGVAPDGVAVGGVDGRMSGRSDDVIVGLPSGGGVLSAEQVQGDAAAVAVQARAADEDRLEDAGPVAGWEFASRYCWSVLAGLSDRWPGVALGEMKAASRWPRMTGWADLVDALAAAGPGTHAYVRFGRFSDVGHAVVLYHTGDEGLVLINPDQHEDTGYTITVGTKQVRGWLAGDVGGREDLRLANAHVSFRDPTGRVVPFGDARPESGSIVQALIDPVHPHTGMPRRRRTAGEWAAELIVRMERGPLTADDLRNVDPGVRGEIFAAIEAQAPGTYVTWREGRTTKYGRVEHVPHGKQYWSIVEGADPANVGDPVLRQAATLIQRMDQGPLTGRDLHDLNPWLRGVVLAAIEAQAPGTYVTWREGRTTKYGRVEHVPHGTRYWSIVEGAGPANVGDPVLRQAATLIQRMDQGPLTREDLRDVNPGVRGAVFAAIEAQAPGTYVTWREGRTTRYGRVEHVPHGKQYWSIVEGADPANVGDPVLRQAATLIQRMDQGPLTANDLSHINLWLRGVVFAAIEAQAPGTYATWREGRTTMYGRVEHVPHGTRYWSIVEGADPAADAEDAVRRQAANLIQRMDQGPLTGRDLSHVNPGMREVVFAAIEAQAPGTYVTWREGRTTMYGRVEHVPHGTRYWSIVDADPANVGDAVLQQAETLIQRMDQGPLTGHHLRHLNPGVRGVVFAVIEAQAPGTYVTWREGRSTRHGRVEHVPHGTRYWSIVEGAGPAADAGDPVRRQAANLIQRMDQGPLTGRDLRNVDPGMREAVFAAIEAQAPGTYVTWHEGRTTRYGRVEHVPHRTEYRPIAGRTVAAGNSRERFINDVGALGSDEATAWASYAHADAAIQELPAETYRPGGGAGDETGGFEGPELGGPFVLQTTLDPTTAKQREELDRANFDEAIRKREDKIQDLDGQIRDLSADPGADPAIVEGLHGSLRDEQAILERLLRARDTLNLPSTVDPGHDAGDTAVLNIRPADATGSTGHDGTGHKPAPHVTFNPDDRHNWWSSSRSARTSAGKLIPDDEQACVSVAVVTR
ncbi:hypothetical protein AB0L00_38645 [Actinoallomurus sp. NPDC052308]|uniref:hypothetical protein n=1 Tax=Actinoallomurus sp. NPDC052308 TaxID=3155530 RepID=UPI00343CCBDC